MGAKDGLNDRNRKGRNANEWMGIEKQMVGQTGNGG